jgi:Ca2+-transporting ATPase
MKSGDQDSYPSSLELPELPEQSTKTSDSTLKPSASIDMLMIPHTDPANPFAFTLEQLTDLVNQKRLDFLDHVGGIEGIAKGLHSHPTTGLVWDEDSLSYIHMYDLLQHKTAEHHHRQQEDEFYQAQFPLSIDAETFTQRRQVFGSNVLPQVEEVTLLQLMWEAFQDKTLVILVASNNLSY